MTADAVFLTHASSQTDFNKLKQTVSKMLLDIDFDPARNRFAFATMGTAGLNLRFDLDDHLTKADLQSAINGLAYSNDGAPNIALALDQLKTSKIFFRVYCLLNLRIALYV